MCRMVNKRCSLSDMISYDAIDAAENEQLFHIIFHHTPASL